MTGNAQPARLPGNAQLAPGEQIQMGGRFMYSTVVFYVHTELVLTNRRLYASRPNMAFGFIPVGTQNAAYPVENIAGVSSSTRFDILGVIFGIFAILAGVVAALIPGLVFWLGILLIVFGVLFIVGAPKQSVDVQNSGGGNIAFPVSFFERSRTVAFANAVSQTLAHGAAAGRPSAPAAMAPAGDAEARLRQLEGLRSQGLISDAEYTAKRSEVLGRL